MTCRILLAELQEQNWDLENSDASAYMMKERLVIGIKVRIEAPPAMC